MEWTMLRQQVGDYFNDTIAVFHLSLSFIISNFVQLTHYLSLLFFACYSSRSSSLPLSWLYSNSCLLQYTHSHSALLFFHLILHLLLSLPNARSSQNIWRQSWTRCSYHSTLTLPTQTLFKNGADSVQIQVSFTQFTGHFMASVFVI